MNALASQTEPPDYSGGGAGPGRWIALLLLLLAAILQVLNLAFVGDDYGRKFLSNFLQAVAALTAAAVTLRAARMLRRSGNDAARGWSLIAAAMWLWALGMCGFMYVEMVLGLRPYPGVPDVFFLLFYPTMILGLWRLPREPVSRREQWNHVLDVAAMAVVGVLVIWQFNLRFILGSLGAERSAGTWVSLGYTLADTLLLLMLFAMLVRKLGQGRQFVPLLLLVIACFCLVTADLFQGYVTTKTDFVSGSPIDFGWVLFSTFAGLAALALMHQKEEPGAERSAGAQLEVFRASWILALTYLWIAMIIGVLIWAVFHRDDRKVDAGLLTIGVVAAAVLVITRQVRTLRENAGLYFGLQQAAAELEAKVRERTAQLEAQRSWLASVVEFLPDPTFVIDRDKKVIAWNKAMEALTGVPKQQVLGQGDHAYAIPFFGRRQPILIDFLDDPPAVADPVYKFVKRVGDQVFAESYLPGVRQGLGAHLWGVAAPLYDQAGKRWGAIEVIRDVTDRVQALERMRENERRTRALFDLSFSFIGLLDVEGTLLDANQSALQLIGATPSEVVGRPFPETPWWRHSPEMRQRLRAAIQTAAGGEVVRFEATNAAADGEIRTVDFSLKPVFGEGKKVTLLIPEGRDITERKKAEERLSRRAAFDAVSARVLAGFASATTEEIDNRIRACLEEIARFVGVDSAIVALFSPDQATWSMAYCWAAAEVPDVAPRHQQVQMGPSNWAAMKLLAGEAVVIHRIEDIPSDAVIERRIFEQDGIKSRLALPLRGRNGRTIGAIGLRSYSREVEWIPEHLHQLRLVGDAVANLLERKAAETALNESEQRFRSLSDAALEGIMIHDQGVILDANRAFAQLFGYERPEDLFGKNGIATLLTPESQVSILQRMERGETGPAEVSGIRKDGTTFVMETESQPMKYLGRDARLVACRDITGRKRAEQALQQSEVRLELATRAAQIGVWDWDVVRNELVWDDSMYRLYGIQREGFAGAYHAWLSCVHPEDAERVNSEIQAALRGEKEYAPEFRVVWPDGSIRFIQAASQTFRDPDGKPVRMIGTNIDITERKRAEAVLYTSEERLRAIVEGTPYLFFYTQDAHAITTYVSPTVEQITGYKPEVWLQARDWFVTDSPINEVARQKTRSHLRGESAEGSIYVEVRHADGRPILLEVYEHPVIRNGTVVGLQGVAHDITERKQAEARIRQQAALLEASHDAILVWDVAEGVQYLNPAAEELTGKPSAEAKSQPLSDVLRTRSELELRGAIQEVTTRGGWAGELDLLSPDNKLRTVASRWTALADASGRAASVLITCNDITQQKRLETQYLRAQRLESVGTLASGVAHDLNNILSPIIMGVEMLGLDAHDADTRTVLAMMQESARRGVDTVKQLLTFARGTESRRGPVQPRHLLKEIARLLQQTFPKNIQVYTDYAERPATVLADPSQLHQVMMNLCVNARDAMPEGGVLFITLENQVLNEAGANLHPKARPGAYVVFKVSDNGAGIPPEILDRIFDPFFTTKPQGKGTGLGLATVLGIVEGHGGFVLVDSRIGEGTTFRVYLPASDPVDAGAAPIEAARAPRGRGEVVLVVDDEPAILRMAEGVLRHGGYQALTATSASEALSMFEKHRDRIQAVLTDIMMPFGDGRQLITMLNQRDPGLPIIAMSGHATRDFQNETLQRGARVFVSKPFTSEELLSALAGLWKPATS